MTTSMPDLTITADRPGALMAREIGEQPDVLRSLLDGRDEALGLGRRIRGRDVRFVLLAARGTSDHAALCAKYLIETVLGLPCGLASMSSTTGYGARAQMEGVLWIAISQSGGSPDLVEATTAARTGGALTLAVTNDADSDLAAVAELTLDIGAGPERSVAATKTYTSELLALWLLVAGWAGRDPDRASSLPDAVSVATRVDVDGVADRLRYAERIVTVGRGFSYPTAREGALKLMETCHLAATAFSGADLLHGPVAHLSGSTPTLVVDPGGVGSRLLSPVLDALETSGVDVCVVGGPGAEIELPVVDEDLSPIVQIVALQRLSMVLAISRGLDPDRPRGLSKVTRTR